MDLRKVATSEEEDEPESSTSSTSSSSMSSSRICSLCLRIHAGSAIPLPLPPRKDSGAVEGRALLSGPYTEDTPNEEGEYRQQKDGGPGYITKPVN